MIEVRNRQFVIGASLIQGWRDRDPVGAAFYDSLSALFPQGERFFMDSVRRYKATLSGPLARDVQAFVAQEAMHSREHLAFNGQVAAAGYDIASLEARTKWEIDLVRRGSDVRQLALTVGLEHFTAALAHCVLNDPAHLHLAPAETRGLWRWHCAEEIEHKAVAFDTLLAVTAHWSAARRWAFRCLCFTESMARLTRLAVPNFLDIRKQAVGEPFPLRDVLPYLFGRPGLLTQMAPALASFFAPGFHPWRRNDLDLAQLAMAEPAPAELAGAD